MDPKEITRTSKLLSFILRHEPGSIGVTLDRSGWVEIDVLIAGLAAHGKPVSREMIERVVAENTKRRFAISDDGRRIRASQGHSVDVELGYEPSSPPALLYHGTFPEVIGAIRTSGLLKMERHHVHLSRDVETARAVGMRRGAPIVLTIAAGRMHEAGHVFYLSANGVWLTDHVPPAFIDFGQNVGT